MPRAPEPLIVPWNSTTVRVRHDDPLLRPYSPRASVMLAARTLVTSTDGLLRVLEATMGDRYRVRAGDPVTVGLWRR